MAQLLAIIRFIILVVCMVPFTSEQQAMAVLAPYLPVTPLLDGTAPTEEREEDDERETADGKERHSAPAKHRLPQRELEQTLPVLRPISVPVQSVSQLTNTIDHFNNGLGTPYRC